MGAYHWQAANLVDQASKFVQVDGLSVESFELHKLLFRPLPGLSARFISESYGGIEARCNQAGISLAIGDVAVAPLQTRCEGGLGAKYYAMIAVRATSPVAHIFLSVPLSCQLRTTEAEAVVCRKHLGTNESLVSQLQPLQMSAHQLGDEGQCQPSCSKLHSATGHSIDRVATVLWLLL